MIKIMMIAAKKWRDGEGCVAGEKGCRPKRQCQACVEHGREVVVEMYRHICLSDTEAQGDPAWKELEREGVMR